MKVLQDILSTIEKRAKKTAVKDVRIGPFWTAVKTLYGGMASTFFKHEPGMKPPIPEPGKLTDKSALELCRWADSENMLRSSLGLAAINSMLEVNLDDYREVNAGDLLLAEGEDKNVTVVGHFPFIKKLQTVAKNLWVLEKRPQPGDLPADKAPEVIPESDIIAITSTTLLNNTFTELIELCPESSLVMMLGPTTPLSPVLFDYNIDIISGTRVVAPEVVLKMVSEGVVFRQMHGRGIKLLTTFKN